MNELRQCGFWIVSASSAIRSLIHRCVVCHKLRGKLGEQKMSDIPKERISNDPPFTHCGVDMFGPFIIKERRSELKRYGALFTCMASRAVHTEVTHSLDADSYIQSLRRFIARRGSIRTLWSDNGTNFVGAEKELWKACFEQNPEVKDFLGSKGADWIVWKKNSSNASHFGGIWERQIRSARTILNGFLNSHGKSLDTKSLQTLMVECEAISNSHPLTVDTISDVNSPAPLAPANILTMKSKEILPPPGVFEKPDIFSKPRWRRVPHIANKFWARWKKEFLCQLQFRQIWNDKQRNFKVGDVVLLKRDSERNEWLMAIIEEVMPDYNGIVRGVKLRIGKSNSNQDQNQILKRSVHKIVLLVEKQI